MTNEEFQRIVLQELRELKEDVGGLKEDVGGLKSGQKALESRQKALESGQKALQAGQKQIRKELHFVWEDIKVIDNRLEKQEIKIRKVVP